MRQMRDKLATDIEKIRQRRAMIKAQLSVADTQDKLNKASESAGKSKGAMSSFERMEEKASRRLDESNAMADLNKEHKDEAAILEEKYASESGSAAVEDELARMKKEMGLSSSDED